MAEEVALKLTVDAVNAANSVKELKQIIKAAADEAAKFEEGSKEFNKFAKVAAEAKDKIGDFREKLAGLNPDAKAQAFARLGNSIAGGFQAATAAAALFGAESEDLQKSLLKVQAATALAQGVQQINEMGKAFNTLGTIIKTAFASNPIGAIATALLAAGAAAVALYEKFKPVSAELGRLNSNFEALKETNKKLNAEYDREILILEAQGKSEVEILELKRKKIQLQIEELKAQREINKQKALEAATEKGLFDSLLRLTGQQLTADILRKKNQLEFLKIFDEQGEALKDLEVQAEATTINLQQAVEERSKEFAKLAADQRMINEALNDGYEVLPKRIGEIAQETVDANQLILTNTRDVNSQILAEQQAFFDAKAALRDEEFNAVAAGLNLLSTIAQGNEQFQNGIFLADRAAAAAKVFIDGITERAGIAAKYAGTPAALPLLIASRLRSAVSLASILSTTISKFKSGGGGGGGPSIGGGGSLPTTSGSVSINPVGTASTVINKDANGDVKNTRVYVLEKDITTTQQKVSSIETKALIK